MLTAFRAGEGAVPLFLCSSPVIDVPPLRHVHALRCQQGAQRVKLCRSHKLFRPARQYGERKNSVHRVIAQPVIRAGAVRRALFAGVTAKSAASALDASGQGRGESALFSYCTDSQPEFQSAPAIEASSNFTSNIASRGRVWVSARGQVGFVATI